MDRNVINTIDDAAFHGIGHEAETIDLSHNRLTDIRLNSVFYLMPNLHTLRLRYNHLQHITVTNDNPGNRLLLPALVELDMTGNDLDQVPTGMLTFLPALRRLILRDNRIRHIGQSAFAGARRLESIDLGANRGGFTASGNRRIMTIDQHAFCGLEPRAFSRQPDVTEWTGLQSLILDHNGLTVFDACSLVGIWTLSELQLTGNPLYCDCRLLTGLHRLTKSVGGFRLNPSTSGAAQCASPDALAGRTLLEAVESGLCDNVEDEQLTRPCLRPCRASLSIASSQLLSSGIRTTCSLRFITACFVYTTFIIVALQSLETQECN